MYFWAASPSCVGVLPSASYSQSRFSPSRLETYCCSCTSANWLCTICLACCWAISWIIGPSASSGLVRNFWAKSALYFWYSYRACFASSGASGEMTSRPFSSRTRYCLNDSRTSGGFHHFRIASAAVVFSTGWAGCWGAGCSRWEESHRSKGSRFWRYCWAYGMYCWYCWRA